MPRSIDSSQPSDEELLAGVRAGNSDALRTLIARYDRLVRYTAFRAARRQCLRDPQWLDGLASLVWAGVIRSVERRPPPADKFTAYLIQITRNKCTDAARQRRQPILLDDAELDLPPAATPAETNGPLDLMVRSEELSVLRECILCLDEDSRRLCGEIVAITERRWRDAAERLGIAESTLRSKWQGVMERLRQAMDARR